MSPGRDITHRGDLHAFLDASHAHGLADQLMLDLIHRIHDLCPGPTHADLGIETLFNRHKDILIDG
jgi:hypothetical protein